MMYSGLLGGVKREEVLILNLPEFLIYILENIIISLNLEDF